MSRPASEGWERWPPHRSLDGNTWLCRWCHKPLDGRKTAWCSSECEYQVRARCEYDIARKLVFERDKGVCAKCGLDTEALQQAINWFRSLGCRMDFQDREAGKRWAEWATHSWPTVTDFVRAIGKAARKWPAELWECNHIVPLAEGGPLADITNLETLCACCHADHTAALMGRIAKAKRREKKFGSN